jgi:hypothetical protein
MGMGVWEEVFEPQIWTNEAVIGEKFAKDLGGMRNANEVYQRQQQRDAERMRDTSHDIRTSDRHRTAACGAKQTYAKAVRSEKCQFRK